MLNFQVSDKISIEDVVSERIIQVLQIFIMLCYYLKIIVIINTILDTFESFKQIYQFSLYSLLCYQALNS